jgi:hypothetical protein
MCRARFVGAEIWERVRMCVCVRALLGCGFVR